MADEKIKILELDETSSLSGLYGVGADTSNHTYKFNLSATIDSKIAGKVDKVTGKGLSTNDYTDAEKSKLAGIPDIESITNAEIDELFN